MDYYKLRKTAKVYHGIMFHHFLGGKSSFNSQGAINASQFRQIINFIGKKNILNPIDFIEKYENNELRNSDVCITFDDSLLSQYEVAVPVLNDFGIQAFFFVYTSIFDGKYNFFETVRYFAANYFVDFYDFCKNFFYEFNDYKNLDYKLFLKDHKSIMDELCRKHPFYNKIDVEYRTLRDNVLTKDEYEKIIFQMFNKYDFDPLLVQELIFFGKKHLEELADKGHLIGLHTHNHPFQLEYFSRDKQLNEYKKNNEILEEIINKKISTMSHPNGSYNLETLDILNDFDLRIGFKASMELDRNMKEYNQSKFEIMREDHTNILKLMIK